MSATSEQMFDIQPANGGITAPDGFRVAGVACGIKKNGALDLALIVPDKLAYAAAVFTTNLAQAAPVFVSREHIVKSGGRAAAVLINSGCANACTGPRGLEVARASAMMLADHLGCQPEHVLVASTGVIGVDLPLEKVMRGITSALPDLARAGHRHAAMAIMTTDPFPKEAAVRVVTPSGTFHVGGIAKGSGMIEPNMATMLGVVTTDVWIDAATFQQALTEAVAVTFNAITVDGECSTNDCVFALAGGASGVVVDEALYPAFVAGLTAVCRVLAREIVRGGEGATKLVNVTVTGARSHVEARQAARAIANSLLVKTAIHGGDPNWGRLVAVAGRAGVAFNLEASSVRIGPVVLFSDGGPHDERAPEAADHLKGTDVDIVVDLGTGGSHSAIIWTCDLSAEYVRINAEYRS